jgi:hypothetical protein
MCQTVNPIGVPIDLSNAVSKANALSSLASTTQYELPSLTPDEQAEEIYQLTVKCRELQNQLDHLYEIAAENRREQWLI